MLSWFCPASFLVLFCGLVLGCDTHHKLLDRAVSGARFLTGGVFECDISHRRSVAVLCMLYKIRCNPVHPLNDALPGAICTGASYTQCSGRTSVHLCMPSLQNLPVQQAFYSPLGVPLERFCCPIFDGVGLAGFKSRANAFLLV